MHLDQVRTQALRHLAAGEFGRALRLHAAILAQLPHDLDARMRVGDICVQLGALDPARQIYAAVAYLDMQSGRPLHALVAMAALTDLGEVVDPLRDALAQLYAAGSPRIARVGARLSPPAPDTPVEVPPDRKEDLAAALGAAAQRAADTSSIREFPSKFQPLPLLSDLSSAALGRLLQCASVRRLNHNVAILRQGDPGDAFYFVAAGAVRVHHKSPSGAEIELAKLYEGAIFGEMALIQAEPRSASVSALGAADIIVFGRDAIRAAADELPALAASLERYTRERLLKNLVATSPLFAPFGPAERVELLKRFTQRDVAEGQDVIVRGDPVEHLYLVLSGELEALSGEPPFEQVAMRLHPGDCFGQSALLDGRPASATVRADRRSTLLSLSRDYFKRLVLTVPEVRAYFESLGAERKRRLADLDAPFAADEDPLF